MTALEREVGGYVTQSDLTKRCRFCSGIGQQPDHMMRHAHFIDD
jgi:hypothetical protein